MKDALDLAIEEIRAMSRDELIAELAAHRDTDIAVSIRELERTAQLSKYLSGKLENLISIIGLDEILEVRSYDFLGHLLELCAANDERFALAA
ncbi:hypothetical protein [Delftia acidovorans]|uniref:Uncharacterized protein n=1 Tax=Delftia acidovorans TaxID=80866 RepID=A0AAJ2R4Y1_DELAC|nr:hypothetical protein [Delftia acidovorans]MDX4955873.1 hypothetical protein [Delftia acidovorans]